MNLAKLALIGVSSSLALALGGCASGPSSSSTLEDVRERGVLRTCAIDGLLPYSNSDPELPGLEIEQAEEIAKALGVKNETVWVGTWDGLIPSLTAGKCDAIIDGLFITEERQKSVDFSDPTWGSGEVIVVREDNDSVRGLEDLADVCVGVLQGSVTVDHLREEGISHFNVYPSQNEILLDVANRGCDAAYLESPSAGWSLEQAPDMKLKIVESFQSSAMYWEGIAVNKGQEDFLRELNVAVREIQDNGTLAKILESYGVPVYLPEPENS